MTFSFVIYLKKISTGQFCQGFILFNIITLITPYKGETGQKCNPMTPILSWLLRIASYRPLPSSTGNHWWNHFRALICPLHDRLSMKFLTRERRLFIKFHNPNPTFFGFFNWRREGKSSLIFQNSIRRFGLSNAISTYNFSDKQIKTICPIKLNPLLSKAKTINSSWFFSSTAYY